MPELPEVETIVRNLRPQVINRVITELHVSHKGENHFNKPISEAKSQLEGRQLLDIARVGKWILLDFEEIKAVAHLRMSGRYLLEDKVNDSPHNRFHFLLDNGQVLNYIDIRRFGTFHLTDSFANYTSLQNLGPDALTAELTADYLQKRLANTTKAIYSALLDQSVIAGLGNIYVNEALHAAQIHPLQPAQSLQLQQLQSLVEEIQTVLQKALKFKGTTLIDNSFLDPEGRSGEFRNLLQVYGRKDDPNIEVLKIGGRSVFVHKDIVKLKQNVRICRSKT